MIQLGTASKTAEANGDVASHVRWLTVFGHGFMQLGRTEQAIVFYDRALTAGAPIEVLQFPIMTYVGKGGALAKLGQYEAAERLLNQALTVAAEKGALGYQAELTMKLGLIAYDQKQTAKALDLLVKAADFARRAGGNRLLAEIALDLGRIQQSAKMPTKAERTFVEGAEVARNMRERLLLPKLLAKLAELRSSQAKYKEAADLLDEAGAVLDGLLANLSSPWLRGRLISVMDEVFVARIQLEGIHTRDPRRMFRFVEQARGRVLSDMLLSRPLAELEKSADLRAGEKEIGSLQAKLFRTKNGVERTSLLDQIFAIEARLGPTATELFNRARVPSPRSPVSLARVQSALRRDELFLEFALADSHSYCIVATRDVVKLRRLSGRDVIEKRVRALLETVRTGGDAHAPARELASAILDPILELGTRKRLIVSPDGDLHHVPFELLIGATGRSLLQSHVVSYIPSGSVLSILRNRHIPQQGPFAALAVSASPDRDTINTSAAKPAVGAISRGVYDVDGADLPQLPSASAEARSVAAILGSEATTVLVGESATEGEVKKKRLDSYRVIHFAVHGVVSTKFPERSALVLRSTLNEDGLLQAREILDLRMDADLVTLSACETGSGKIYGQEGVSNLVRPFLAAGARSVVANLWSADDTFSPTLMREFYHQLARGVDKAEALRQAKLKMIEQFGSQAFPKLWSGLVMYGDGVGTLSLRRSAEK